MFGLSVLVTSTFNFENPFPRTLLSLHWCKNSLKPFLWVFGLLCPLQPLHLKNFSSTNYCNLKVLSRQPNDEGDPKLWDVWDGSTWQVWSSPKALGRAGMFLLHDLASSVQVGSAGTGLQRKFQDFRSLSGFHFFQVTQQFSNKRQWSRI